MSGSRRSSLSLLALAGLLGGGLSAMSEDGTGGAAVTVIDIERSAHGVDIVGRAVAFEPGLYRGEMTISRQGASGSVSTRQSREFELAAGETGSIARVGVSHSPGDKLEVTIVLTQNGSVISRSSLTAGGD